MHVPQPSIVNLGLYSASISITCILKDEEMILDMVQKCPRTSLTTSISLIGSEQYIRPDVSICIVRKSLSLVMTLKMVNAFYLSF